jgi:hypothetical protein
LRIAASLLFLSAFLVVAGCQAHALDTSVPLDVPSSPVAELLSTLTPVPPTQGDILITPSQFIPLDAGLQNLIDKARMDLAQQLSIPMTQIHLIQAISATWQDSSLECPQLGLAYSQVLTPGYLIQLQADNRVYEYHTDADQLVVFCGENTIEYPVKPGDIEDDKPWIPP